MQYWVEDMQNREKQPSRELSVSHDVFEKLWRNQSILQSRKKDNIYYHNNRKNNVVNDVINPWQYPKESDNNKFYLSISKRNPSFRRMSEMITYIGIEIIIIEWIRNRFSCNRCLLFHEIIGMFLWETKIHLIEYHMNKTIRTYINNRNEFFFIGRFE